MNNPDMIKTLSRLKPVRLAAMDCVRFMNRTDTKYMFPVSRLGELIENLQGRYKVLEIQKLKIQLYSTTYFDTPDYLFYYQHVNGHLERHKVRLRTYESTGESFLEVKTKNNKNRTIKNRLSNCLFSSSVINTYASFIKEHSSVDPAVLKPVLINRFIRATLISFATIERITIDFNLSFTDFNSGEFIDMPYLAIAELKKEGHSVASTFNVVLKNMGIYPTGFSKYCIGSAILNDSLRKNILKPKLLKLKKVEDESIRSIIDNSK
jgi:hypothetical protein